MRNLAFCLQFIVVLFSCREAELGSYHELEGGNISLDDVVTNHIATVLVFMGPECPLCESYAYTMRSWKDQWNGNEVAVLGVVSGTYYTPQEMASFMDNHNLWFPVLFDRNFSLAKRFKATITPEVLLLDNAGRERYQGAIDNWAVSLGRKRAQPTEFYLNDALTQHLGGHPVQIPLTKAVGCYIE